MSLELLIFLAGLVAVLAGLQNLGEVMRKSRWAIALFALGLLAQAGTQYGQFRNAVGNKLEAERKSAFALYAYTEQDLALLKRIAVDNPYLIGYRLFRDGRYEAAAGYFNEAISNNMYVAPSHYLLATIARKTSKDWTLARKHLEEALTYDNRYSAAYYGRAIMKVKANEISSAIEDLQRAAAYGVAECYDLANENEAKEVWSAIAELQDFKDLQNQCRTKYDIPDRSAL
jgi:hypothetical protein